MGFSEFQKRDKNETKSDGIESRLWKELGKVKARG